MMNRTKRLHELSIARSRVHIPNQHLTPTGYREIQKNINSFDFFIAIGHGEHKPNEEPVIIPDNVYVVFTTAPGYWGNLLDSLDSKFLSLIKSARKIRELVLDRLNTSELPTLMTHRKWNWKSHIYPPKSICAAHTLSFFDLKKGTPENTHGYWRGKYTAFDNIAGMYHVPSERRMFHGKDKTLRSLVNEASKISGSKPCILFISGCRGDPSLVQSMQTLANNAFKFFKRNIVSEPQIYFRPSSSFIKSIENYETRLRRQLNTPIIRNRVVPQTHSSLRRKPTSRRPSSSRRRVRINVKSKVKFVPIVRPRKPRTSRPTLKLTNNSMRRATRNWENLNNNNRSRLANNYVRLFEEMPTFNQLKNFYSVPRARNYNRKGKGVKYIG